MQTVLYNQRQQVYLAGYAAAMVTTAKICPMQIVQKKLLSLRRKNILR